MKKKLNCFRGLAILLFGLSPMLQIFATPSTAFWAPSTPYTQPFGVLHVTYDSYFNNQYMTSNYYGLTMGVIPSDLITLEVGFDYLGQSNLTNATTGAKLVDFQLNAKIGMGWVGSMDEKAFPFGWSLGIMGVGFNANANNYNVLYLVVGKNTPIGAFAVGPYYALNKTLFKDVITGADNNIGVMASYTSPDIKIGMPYLDKIVLVADVMTGNHAFGAYGAGITFYFTPAIDLLTGPVIPFQKAAFGGNSLLWTLQLDVDLDFNAKKTEPTKTSSLKDKSMSIFKG